MPGRYVAWVVALLGLAGLFTCWCETPLIWDGAYQLAIMLQMQEPYSFEGRFHSYILWLPIVPLSRWTEDVHILQFVYGLPFALAPMAGVGLSWWIVRKERPELMIWPIYGIAAATLPGQIFIINDSIFQQHLFWPLFMAVFVHVTRGQLAVLVFLLVFQFSHAIGFLLLTGAAGSSLLLSLVDRENRKGLLIRTGVFAVLAAGALAKIYLVPDSYAATEATWEKAVERWEKGVAGWPVRGLAMMWASAAMVLAGGILGRFGRAALARGAMGLAMLLAGVGLGMWIYWASDAHRWAMVIDFRRWVVPLTMPFFAGALFEALFGAWWRRRAGGDGTHPDKQERPLPMGDKNVCPTGVLSRGGLALMLACGFVVVLTIQSVQWVRMSNRLMAEVRAYPGVLVPHDSFPWADGTALQHWATITYVMVQQGKRPEKLIVDQTGYEAIMDPVRARIAYSWFHLLPPEPGPGGWYDHRGIVKAVRGEER